MQGDYGKFSGKWPESGRIFRLVVGIRQGVLTRQHFRLRVVKVVLSLIIVIDALRGIDVGV